MQAEIIAIGSEMLTPWRQDTNSLYLTAGLNALGVPVAFKTIVGDTFQHLTGAIRTALSRADILLLSGGLGPTEDDLTREAVAEVLGLTLHPDATLLAGLEARFAARNLPMPPNNRKQADLLDGATLLPNALGSASGQFVSTSFAGEPRIVVLLPGPPRELKPLFDTEAAPRLAALLPPAFLARRQLRMALIPESVVDARTAPIYNAAPGVSTTILAGSAEIQLHFESAAPTLAEAQGRVDRVAALVAQEMAGDIFSTNGDSLEQVVLTLLTSAGQTLAVAESCTGGLLGQRITAISGASAAFLGGAIVYSNALKTALAGVPPALLTEYGAVSEPVARALAEGIRIRTGATFALAITGIAGPASNDTTKPVGLVHVALATPACTLHRKLQLTGERDRIRWWSTQHALELLRRHLLHTAPC